MSNAVYKLKGNFTKKIDEASELLKNSVNAELISEVVRTA